MRLAFKLVNVFTQAGGKLTGNPLCVFEDARGLTDAQMQALALQFNLSETTFVFPSDHADARVRIFTPNYEMPFAGHPTLGTAHVVRSNKALGAQVRLELNVGVIPVAAAGGRWELRANAATHRRPQAAPAAIAAALGLDATDLAGQPLWVNSGSEQLIVPLASESAVRRVQLSVERMKEVTQDGPRAQAYVFAATGRDTLFSRFFFNQGSSMIEDPATGSATANLGGWYLANSIGLPMTKTISQGEFCGRPSSLQLRIDSDRAVFVSGEVLDVGAGQFDL